MNYKEKNVYEKIESVKEILKPLIEDKNNKDIKRILCHCVYYKMGRKKELVGEEKEFYDFLLKHDLKPKTLYEWFLLLDVPEHIKKQLEEKRIGRKNAQSRAFAYKRMIGTKNGKEIMTDIMVVIRRLEWKGLNTT